MRTQRHRGHHFLAVLPSCVAAVVGRGGVCHFCYGEPLLFLNAARSEERDESRPRTARCFALLVHLWKKPLSSVDVIGCVVARGARRTTASGPSGAARSLRFEHFCHAGARRAVRHEAAPAGSLFREGKCHARGRAQAAGVCFKPCHISSVHMTRRYTLAAQSSRDLW